MLKLFPTLIPSASCLDVVVAQKADAYFRKSWYLQCSTGSSIKTTYLKEGRAQRENVLQVSLIFYGFLYEMLKVSFIFYCFCLRQNLTPTLSYFSKLKHMSTLKRCSTLIQFPLREDKGDALKNDANSISTPWRFDRRLLWSTAISDWRVCNKRSMTPCSRGPPERKCTWSCLVALSKTITTHREDGFEQCLNYWITLNHWILCIICPRLSRGLLYFSWKPQEHIILGWLLYSKPAARSWCPRTFP